MTYLTIRTATTLPARRVDFAQFARLFDEPEASPPPRPRRSMARLLAAPLLLAALAGDFALLVRPTALATGSRPAPALTPS